MLAREMGANWVGGANATPPVLLDSAILFASVGDVVPSRSHYLIAAGPWLLPASIRAHQRGVHVRLAMDLKNASGRDSKISSAITFLMSCRSAFSIGGNEDETIFGAFSSS
jgi:hypothetical protein